MVRELTNQIETISVHYNDSLKCYSVHVETFDHRSYSYRHKASSLDSLIESVMNAIRLLERGGK